MATRTFLFVDQVASTEQLTRLGDQVARVVRRDLFTLLRQASALNGGEEVDFTGDGLFCAFEGASEAVDAAVMMQQLVATSNRRRPADQHLDIRIGINAGEPLASEGGGYFGTAVVVGARLCSVAGTGEVLVSEIVRILVEPQGVRRFEPAGSFTLKGVPNPVAGYRVVWTPDDRPATLPAAIAAALPGEDGQDGAVRAPVLVGREEELRIADQAWAAVQQGSRRLLLVTGEPGLGVTRLAAEIAGRHGAGAATVLHGAALGRTSRLSPWSRAIGDWMHAVPEPELRLAVGRDGEDLLRLVPALHRLVPRLPQPAPADDAEEVEGIAAAIDRLVSRWSELEPVVLVLDRLDQADAASLRILRRLMESTLPARLLVIAGSRASQVGSPAVGAALGQLPGVLTIALQPLSAEDTGLIAAAVGGEELEPAALRAVHAESAGNPAQIVEIAVGLRERALARRAADALGRVAELRSDLRTQRAEIAEVVQELEQLRDDGVREQAFTEDGDPVSPYKGLAAYQPEDADDFYGRELLVAELVAKLASSRFLAVIGPSGSGKSSVVRAGLIPALARESVPGSSSWVPVIATPANETIADALQRGRQQAHGQPIALFVDQFEELWTAAQAASADEDGDGARRDALDLLLAAVDAADDQAVVVVSMRADYYGRTAEHPALAALMSESQILVPPMTPGELRRAIEAPARRAGLSLEQGLVQAAISDIGDGAGRLPLLSTAMFETWQRRQGRSLTLAGYAAAGGARRAIATLAEDAFATLTPEEQEAARRIFLRLADPDDSGGDVARPATLRELGDDEVVRRVLERLATRRLVTIGATSVQVTHEALLREWPRLREWLDADREGRRLHHQVSGLAREWEESGREPEALVRGARLSVASEWATANAGELTADERAFLDASERDQQAETLRRRRQVRRLKVLAAGLVSLLVLASIATGFGLVQAREAGSRANEATASELAAQAGALASTNSETALLLAVEGYQRDPSVSTEGGLLTALNGARFRTRTVTGLPEGVIDTVITRSGARIYALTEDGDIVVADTKDLNRSARRIVTGIQSGSVIALSHGERLLAYSAGDGVTVVDAVTGSRVAGPLPGAGGEGEFSADDRYLVSAGYPSPGVTVTELATGKSVTRDLSAGQPTNIAASPSANEFVAASLFGNTLRRYRFDFSPIAPAVKTALSSINGFTYSPDGKTIAVGSGDNLAAVVSSTTLTGSVPTVRVRGSRIYDANFSPQSDVLVLGSDDGSAEVVDVSTGTALNRLSGLSGGVQAIFLDSRRILVSTTTQSAEFDIAQRTPLGTNVEPSDPRDAVLAIAADRSASTLYVSSPASVSLRDARLAQRGRVASVPDSGLTNAALAPNGQSLAIYSKAPDGSGGRLEVRPVRGTGTTVEVAVPEKDFDVLGVLAWSPNGRMVAIRTAPGTVTVVDVAARTVLATSPDLDPLGAARALGWSPDSKTVYFGGQSGVLNFVDPKTGKARGRLSLSPGLELDGVAPLPGGRLVAVSSESGFVYLVDTRTGQLSGDPLAAGGTQLQAVAASPDGGTIAAISRDGALRLWDVATRRAVGPALGAHDTQAASVTFLSNDQVVSGDLAGVLVSWNLDPSSWVRTACTLAGRDLTASEWKQYLPDQPYRKTCSGR